MRSADALCLLLSDLPGAERVIPAKLFEYIASGRPIVAIAPEGDVRDLLRDHPGAVAFPPGDVPAIGEWLARAIQGEVRMPEPGMADTDTYSRRRQAQQLASLLEGFVCAPQCHGRAKGVPCSA
jgi:glycosyltransferase involved in cell wall biosynthesis